MRLINVLAVTGLVAVSAVMNVVAGAPANGEAADSPKPQLEIKKSEEDRPFRDDVHPADGARHKSEEGGSGVERHTQRPIGGTPAEDLIGMPVVNNAGEEIGKVEAVVRSLETAALDAVVSVGGFLGIGAKKVSIPLQELELTGEARLLAPLADSGQDLREWPAFDASAYEKVPDQRVAPVGMHGDAPR